MRPELALLIAAQRLGWRTIGSAAAVVATVSAIAAVTLEVTHRLADWPAPLVIGHLPVPVSVIPLAVAVAAGGTRALGRPTSRESKRVFWALSIVALASGSIAIAGGRPPGTVLALVLVGFLEELMYRGAIPAVATYLLVRRGVAASRAGIIGLCVGGAAFVVLPGHVAQYDDVSAVPFVAFAVLAATVVWRTGALLELAALHAVVNTVNIGRFDGVSEPAGALLLAALMIVLVLAYAPVGRRIEVVIDLTGDAPAVDRVVTPRWSAAPGADTTRAA